MEARRPRQVLFVSLLFAQFALCQPVRVEEGVQHEGQASFRITTKSATWIYHAAGGGFASLLDSDGKDWISYHPGNRSAGEFRGIPNLGPVAHPGHEGSRELHTVLEAGSGKRARLRSTSADGKWELVWDFYPEFARLTIEKAGEPYWFLYEGTPAGRLDLQSGFWGLPDGVRRRLSETWNSDIAGREWVYFGDTDSGQVLFLVNHQDDSANDQFWQMESNMTVWGFGRQYRCCGRYLTEVPARFTVGLARGRSFRAIRKAVQKALRER